MNGAHPRSGKVLVGNCANTLTPSGVASCLGSSRNTAGGATVPGDLVGRRLDLAVSELASQGLNARYEPVIPGNEPLREWGVCSSTPSVGQSVSATVVLHIARFACGGGSNSVIATGSTPGVGDVKVAWHQVTEALVRQDGTTACADLTASLLHQFAVEGSSCKRVVEKRLGFYTT